MDSERWQHLQRLFDATVDMDADEREAFLARECPDRVLRGQVLSLVVSSRDADEFLGGAVFGAIEKLTRPLEPGQSVGPYIVRQKIGEGGMGAVFLAERSDEFHQLVALKVLHGAAGQSEAHRRFRAERRILARLEHPGIARLIDGGSTEDGHPFFVMEYVEGRPIDRYCEEANLSIRERIALFREVCDAVAYAHRRLVIHRDLKPGNILVLPSGRPKLLDFGIAKLVEPDTDENSLTVTRAGVRLLTPEYASPEQVRGSGITTASDVYSLGVLLYELLVGRRPYVLESSSLTELERKVCFEEPSPPSLAAREAVAATTRRETRGDSRSRQLRKELQGDLDNVVMMALRKEPDRRYASVLQLSDDLGRYLEGRPVAARKETWQYVAGKFVRRNRAAVVAAGVAIALLVGFTVMMGVSARQIALERNRANEEAQHAREEAQTSEHTVDFLTSLFEEVDPNQTRGEQITAREMLDRGAERLQSELSDEPAVQAQLAMTIGTVYRSLGLYDDAIQLLEHALAVRESQIDTLDSNLATNLGELAQTYRQAGRFVEAESLLWRADEVLVATLGPEHADRGALRNSLAMVAQDLGEHDVALQRFEEALPMLERALGKDHPSVAIAANNLAMLHQEQGHHGEAEPMFRRSIATLEKALGADHPNVAVIQNNLARALRELGRLDEADSVGQRSLATLVQAFGEDHPNVGVICHTLAGIALDRKELDRAESLSRRSTEILIGSLGEDHPRVALAAARLARIVEAAGRPDEADSLLQRCLAIQVAALPPEHPDARDTRNQYVEFLRRQGRRDEAERVANPDKN